MGDRALIILKDATEASPIIYMHWDGSNAETYIKELGELMKGREDDLSYATARMVGICHNHIAGNLGLGLWNIKESEQVAVLSDDKDAITNMSHGDAGVFVIDVKDFTFKNYK